MKIYSIVKVFVVFNIICLLQKSIYAHHKIYSPRVKEGRQSFEWRGHFDVDDSDSYDKQHHHVLETEYSWTDFWQSELELHISDKKDTPLDWEKTEFQNQFQIFDKDNFASALYFSFNFVSSENKGDEIEYKYLNEFSNRTLSLTTNFIFEKQVGKNSSGGTEFSFSNYLLFKKPVIKGATLGLIGFSEMGYIRNFNTFSNQEHHYGIQLNKEFFFSKNEFEFSIGYLTGITDSSADHKIIWNTEIEF
tara:strand:+ start:922 stop:1665 length:744 start_codon:yes stop_codon:yes gene_type:complete